MSVVGSGKAWGEISILAGSTKELLITVKDANGAPVTIDGTYELWFRNTDTTKAATDFWGYGNDDITVVDAGAGQISVVIEAGDNIARGGNKYNIQLWRTDTNNPIGSGVLSVLLSARDPNEVGIVDNIPGGIVGLLVGAGDGTFYAASYSGPISLIGSTLTVTPPDLSAYLPLAGGTMTGVIHLGGHPFWVDTIGDPIASRTNANGTGTATLIGTNSFGPYLQGGGLIFGFDASGNLIFNNHEIVDTSGNLYSGGIAISSTYATQTALSLKANNANPAMTGTFSAAGGNLTSDADGNGGFAGSLSVSNGFVARSGDIQSSGALFAGNGINTLSADGSFSLADGNVQGDIDGNITAPNITLFAGLQVGSGSFAVNIAAIDGSATFAGAVSVAALAIRSTAMTITGAGIYVGGLSVTGLSTPLNATDAATKQYVDTLVSGLEWKAVCTCATTANITLSGEQTIDGVLTSGSRVLVMHQTTATQNGIYVSNSGAWTRSTDASTGIELENATVYIQAGSTNGLMAFTCTAQSIIVGTTAIAFIKMAVSLGSLIAANNLSDLTSASTARTNLGLGTAAVVNLGTSVATALAIGVGSAGAVIINGGNAGTPSGIALTNGTGLPIAGISGLGSLVGTMLGTGVGTAGGPVVNGGQLGTPSSGVATNLTGTAAGLTAGTASAVPASGITGATLASGVTASSLLTFGSGPTLASPTTTTNQTWKDSSGNKIMDFVETAGAGILSFYRASDGLTLFQIAASAGGFGFTTSNANFQGATNFQSITVGSFGTASFSGPLTSYAGVDLVLNTDTNKNINLSPNGTGVVNISSALCSSAPSTTVSGSVSGTATFSQPMQGGSLKLVIVECNALVGTATYTFPSAFLNTPSVFASNDIAASVVSTKTTASATLTGTTSTGSLLLVAIA